MVVGVQVDNPNQGFCRRLGGHLVGRRPLNWAGYETEELLYGYDDIGPLVNEA
jgi:hypothetical protein